jgi:uncharacterized membrane protein
MRCANCGVEMIAGAAFCPSCGRPVQTVAGGSSAAAASVSSPRLRANVAGALCYLAGFATGILFLVLEPYRRDRFIRFHAWQSIFLSIAWLALHVTLHVALSTLPWTLWRLTETISSLVPLALFPVVLLTMFKAYGNEQFKLLVIGDLAQRQAG